MGADALILDLEDSVPPENKPEARAPGPQNAARVGRGGSDTGGSSKPAGRPGLTGEDLEAVTGPHLYCVMLPKVESPADVVEVDNLLKHFERREGMEVGRIFIDPALETAQGIRQSYEIATASPRVAHMGASGGKGGDTARFPRLPVDP